MPNLNASTEENTELLDMELLTAETFTERVSTVESGVCLMYKPSCPFCVAMETVIKKFQGMAPGAEIFGVNVAKNKGLAERFKVERLPTVLIIRGGVVVSKRSGIMKAKHLNGLYLMMDTLE